MKLQSIPKEIITINNEEEFNKLLKNFPEKIVIIDFWAVWCAPCKIYAPVFKKAHEKNSKDFIFAKVNVDENSIIAQYYGITSIPTTLFVKGSQVLHKFGGAVNYDTLMQIIEKVKS
ncbi:hypothetical protein LCGC14_0806000 [marine sediment metagenome]|uniref:Thioredoxin domain-containing protein n=1 Tax=marine sediment metagenome TaxID=412755 RepID=A0A0F9PN49_9ZZZZ